MKGIKISYSLPSHIDRQHNQLKILVGEVSSLIKKKNNEFKIEESSIDFVELDIDEFEHHTGYLEDHIGILTGITQTLFSSIFVSIYSHLETNLSLIISEIETCTEYRIKSKHLKRDGSFINSLLNYLKLVQNIDLNNFQDSIDYLNDITFVRNIFTHTRGILPKENTKIKRRVVNFINENDGIQLRDNFIIITKEEFLEKIIDKNSIFLLKLINFVSGK